MHFEFLLCAAYGEVRLDAFMFVAGRVSEMVENVW